ncbi:MAG: D-aminoacyl-tRNA deacylase [Ktedonobacterales bacterium]
MRAVVQRSIAARVLVAGTVVGQLDPTPGLVVLLGVGPEDTAAEAEIMAGKIAGLRIFADQTGKINLSLTDLGGGALVISQFTLYADLRRGRRPGFTGAAAPEIAKPLVECVSQELQRLGIPVQSGHFGADMQVELVNDGPMTILLDTDLWHGSGVA